MNQERVLIGPCGMVDPEKFKTIFEWMSLGVIPTCQPAMAQLSNPKLKKRVNHQPHDLECHVLMESGFTTSISSGIGGHKNSKRRKTLLPPKKSESQNSLAALSDGSRRVYAHGPPVRACHD